MSSSFNSDNLQQQFINEVNKSNIAQTHQTVRIANSLQICKTSKPIPQAPQLNSYHIAIIQVHIDQLSQQFSSLQRSFSANELEHIIQPLRKIDHSLSSIKNNCAGRKLKTLAAFLAPNQLLRTAQSLDRILKAINLQQETYGVTFSQFNKLPAELRLMIWNHDISMEQVVSIDQIPVYVNSGPWKKRKRSGRVFHSGFQTVKLEVITQNRTLRQVCYESRAACDKVEVKTSLQYDDGKDEFDARSFSNWETDILFFPPGDNIIPNENGEAHTKKGVYMGLLWSDHHNLSIGHAEHRPKLAIALEDWRIELLEPGFLIHRWLQDENCPASQIILVVAEDKEDYHARDIVLVKPRKEPVMLLSSKLAAWATSHSEVDPATLTWETLAEEMKTMVEEIMDLREDERQEYLDGGGQETDAILAESGVLAHLTHLTFHKNLYFMEAVSRKKLLQG